MMNLRFVLLRKHTKPYKFRSSYKTSHIPLIFLPFISPFFANIWKKYIEKGFFFFLSGMVLHHFLQVPGKCCLDICRSTNHYPYYGETTGQRELAQRASIIQIKLNR